MSVFQAFSRGTLWITTGDADVHPVVDHRMHSDERDLVRMRDGGDRTASDRRGVIEQIVLGRCDGLVIDDVADPEALDARLHASMFDTRHPVGTCRMGVPTIHVPLSIPIVA